MKTDQHLITDIVFPFLIVTLVTSVSAIISAPVIYARHFECLLLYLCLCLHHLIYFICFSYSREQEGLTFVGGNNGKSFSWNHAIGFLLPLGNLLIALDSQTMSRDIP
jgi:hypothetical protein